MRVLFDQGTPASLREFLPEHDVSTAHERGWSILKNGALLDIAQQENFAVFVTTDSNLKYQQQLKFRRIAVVVLSSTSWPRIERVADAMAHAIDNAVAGTYFEVEIP